MLVKRRDSSQSLVLQFTFASLCFIFVNLCIFHELVSSVHHFDMQSLESITHSKIHLNIESTTGELPKQDSFIQLQKKNVTAHDVPEDGFAGCLLLKDDNDRLSEWIAYHWLTLPLKYLIVAVDPTGTTSPKHILDEWRKADMGMDIVLWDDADYGHWIDEELDDKHRHRDRQMRFTAECQRHHKAKGRDYVVIVDPDEFITYNVIADDEPQSILENIDNFPELYTKKKYTQAMRKLRKDLPTYLANHITIFEYLRQHKAEEPWESEMCHLMVRLYFSAIESDPAIIEKDNVSKYGLDHNRFSTLRYFHHEERTIFGMNRYGKVLVNLKKTPWDELDRDMDSIHQPNYPSCKDPLKPYINGILRVHHYLGSWEQYFSRVDVRRTKEKYEEGNSVDAGVDFQLQDWLYRFLQIVGAEKSRKLLKYAGIIDVKKGQNGEVTEILDRPGYRAGKIPKDPDRLDEENHYYDENGRRWVMKKRTWVLAGEAKSMPPRF